MGYKEDIENLKKDYSDKVNKLNSMVDTTKEPYLYVVSKNFFGEIGVRAKYNPKFGNDKECVCGHPYHRHFDSYEDDEDVGCKYCRCSTFIEKK